VLYDLRHTFASTLLAKGAPITYVAQQMGHANANITLKYYARWIPSADRSFVDSLDNPGLAPLRKKPRIYKGICLNPTYLYLRWYAPSIERHQRPVWRGWAHAEPRPRIDSVRLRNEVVACQD
jgi:hypothetical protein